MVIVQHKLDYLSADRHALDLLDFVGLEAKVIQIEALILWFDQFFLQLTLIFVPKKINKNNID